MQLVFATHNLNKLKEVQALMPAYIQLLSLTDIDCTEEIPETAETIEGNAILKANHVTSNHGYNCFADDTGLEIHALNGEPGVDSAFYAGPQRSSEDNINLLLKNLTGKPDRSAQFRTVVTLYFEGKEFQFEGIVEGTILEEKLGEGGFGYDPVFQPKGYDVSFAQMPLDNKNQISHRGRAVKKLMEFLEGKA